jgi:hypothetical protein
VDPELIAGVWGGCAIASSDRTCSLAWSTAAAPINIERGDGCA